MFTNLRQRVQARDESGFTLIELLVVLIIIGVLLAIAVPSYLGFKDRAEKRAAQSDVRAAIPSAEAYYEDNNNDYSGMDLAALQGIDGGTKVDDVSSTATTYCLAATVGKWTAYVQGPADSTVAGSGVVNVGAAGSFTCP